MDVEIDDFVEPVHAESFFSVSRDGEIHERLSFEYYDPDGYYRRVMKSEKAFAEEIEKLSANMQYFLDKERVEINKQRVRSFVNYCDVFLKGSTEVVSVVYLIDFIGAFTVGINNIETWLEEEEAPYDFEIIWRFPQGTKVADVDTMMEYAIYGDILTLWAYEGEMVGGYEKLRFDIPITDA